LSEEGLGPVQFSAVLQVVSSYGFREAGLHIPFSSIFV